MEKVSELRERIDIVKEIGSRVELKKKGQLYSARCPFHEEKSPSFYVYPASQTFYCFGCGAKRDIVDFVARYEGVDFKRSMEILAGDSFVSNAPKKIIQLAKKEIDAESAYLQYEEPELLKLREHAAQLNVTAGSLRLLDIRYSKAAWVFPQRDENLKIIGLRFRAEDSRKWSLTGGLAGLFIPSMKVQDSIYIAEGPTDCAALLSLGFYAIGRPSCLGQEEMIAKFVKQNRIKHAVIVSDNDTAKQKHDGSQYYPGYEGAKRLQEALKISTQIWIPPIKDVREFLANGGTHDIVQLLTKDLL